MLQRPSANPVSATADVADAWQRTPSSDWFDSIRRVIALPTTLRSFTVFLLALSLIAAATALQVYLSAQILESEYEINGLRTELDAAERMNAEVSWQIAMLSRLENVEARATSLGFKPVVDETYVTRSSVTRSTDVLVADIPIDTKAPPQLFYADLPVESSETVPATSTTAGSLATFGANVEAGLSRMVNQGEDRVTGAFENARRWLGGE